MMVPGYAVHFIKHTGTNSVTIALCRLEDPLTCLYVNVDQWLAVAVLALTHRTLHIIHIEPTDLRQGEEPWELTDSWDAIHFIERMAAVGKEDTVALMNEAESLLDSMQERLAKDGA